MAFDLTKPSMTQADLAAAFGSVRENFRAIVDGDSGVFTMSRVEKANQTLTGNVSGDSSVTKGHYAALTTDSFAINKGAAISVGGKFNAAGAYVLFGAIAGRKENATDGNTAGYLGFWTNSATGLLECFRISSAGVGLFGEALTQTHAGSRFEIRNTQSGPAVPVLVVVDETAMAAGVGGTIAGGGKYTAVGNYAQFGAINFAKENATDADLAGMVRFYTRASGGFLERIRITSTGQFLSRVTSSALASGAHFAWASGDTSTTLYAGSSNASNNQIAIKGESYSSTPIWGVTNSNVAILGDAAVAPATSQVIVARDTSAFAAGVGGSLGLNGKYTAAGTPVVFAVIQGYKINATDGDNAGGLRVYTRPNAGSLTERVRITNLGDIEVSPSGSTSSFGRVYQNSSGIYIDAIGSGIDRAIHLRPDTTNDYVSITTTDFSVVGINVSLFQNGGSYGGGVDVLFAKNAATVPSTNPTGGGILYAEAGAGKWRGSSGTVTTFGPAEPHCPECGRDFVHEWRNDGWGESLVICMWCLTEELGDRPWVTKAARKAS